MALFNDSQPAFVYHVSAPQCAIQLLPIGCVATLCTISRDRNSAQGLIRCLCNVTWLSLAGRLQYTVFPDRLVSFETALKLLSCLGVTKAVGLLHLHAHELLLPHI